jgi:hypothetical protein
MTQSTIFPCPAVPESVQVSESKAYWHRFTTADGLAIVRLRRNPVSGTTEEGDTMITFDDLEVRLTPGELETLAENFDEVWEEHRPDGEPVVYPL